MTGFWIAFGFYAIVWLVMYGPYYARSNTVTKLDAERKWRRE